VIGQDSLFGNGDGSSDLQVGVLIDEIRGRYCIDCPNIFNGKSVPASVVMNARWEIYSSLERRVVARITTSGGANILKPLEGNLEPAIYAAFRDQVQRLIATEEFRQLVSRTGTIKAATPVPEVLSFRAVAAGKRPLASAADSVVSVLTGDGHGSGFLVSEDGHILTNQHVVGGAKYVKVRWPDGSETLGEVLRSDRVRDVALIKAERGSHKPLSLRTAAPTLGETVFAIGTPLQEKLQGSVTKGIVSANRTYEGLSYIQSDVTVNQGNSGGPLLDENGAVLGLTVSGIDISGAPSGVNFFIPIMDALRALNARPAA
jgi:serine protease Do